MSERLSPQREAEIDGRAAELFEYSTSHSPEWDLLAGEDVPALLAELAAVRAERDRYRAAWQSASYRAEARGEGILRVTRDRESYQGWLEQEQAHTQHLRAELAQAKRAAHCQSVAAINGTHCSLPIRHCGDHQNERRTHYWSDEFATDAPVVTS